MEGDWSTEREVDKSTVVDAYVGDPVRRVEGDTQYIVGCYVSSLDTWEYPADDLEKSVATSEGTVSGVRAVTCRVRRHISLHSRASSTEHGTWKKQEQLDDVYRCQEDELCQSGLAAPWFRTWKRRVYTQRFDVGCDSLGGTETCHEYEQCPVWKTARKPKLGSKAHTQWRWTMVDVMHLEGEDVLMGASSGQHG